jgi:NADH-quinone oxidoreductase subunit N
MEFNFLQSLPAIAPEIGLTIMAVVVLFLDMYLPESQRRGIAYVAGIGLLGTAALSFFLFAPTPETTGLYWGGTMRHDTLAHLFKIIVLIAGALTCMIAVDARSIARQGEFYLIIIVSTLGAALMAGAADLVMVFLALETTTIPLYVLAAFNRDDKRSVESGMKYFLFGAFASAILLYGLSLLYGFSGSTNLYAVAEFLGSGAFSSNAAPVLIAIALIVTGFGFKISAAPFHFWTPDVYEGAPTPVTAFLSVASKAASFALMVRFFTAVFPAGLVLDGQQISGFWTQLAAVLALLSMTFGNLVALAQKNFKRLMAYSSIAQAGYTLMGVAALTASTDISIAAIAFYMFMYTFTNMLAFGVLIYFSEATGSDNIRDLAGLSRRNPMLALAMTIALLSLAGVPPAAGFFGKFFLFQATVEAGLVWLAIAGVLNAIVALYYYLVVIKVMYVDHGAYEEMDIPVSRAGGYVLAAATVVVVLLGTILATPLFDWALRGAASMG